MTQGTSPPDGRPAINLKDPALAAFLAWLIPGLGHLYQGRTAKAILLFVCIMGTFVFGVWLGGSSELGWGRVVYASWRPEDRRLPYLCQIGVGLPAMPALVQASRARSNKPLWWKGFMAPPSDRNFPTLDDLHKELGHCFELGTVYTMIAGLLNILAIYDAWGGPVFSERKKEGEDEDDEKEEDSDASPQEVPAGAEP